MHVAEARKLADMLVAAVGGAPAVLSGQILRSLDPAPDPAFTEERVSLSAFVGSPAVQVRFTFASDRSVVREGWYVDDIRVEKTILDCGPDDFLRTMTTTTTTTTTLPCRSDAECDDGVRCTADTCSEGICHHAALAGPAGFDCKVAETLESALCGAEKVDPRLEHYIRSRLETARALLVKADRTRDRKRLATSARRAARVVKGIEVRVAASVRKRRISATCLVTIEQRLRRLRQALLAI